jgi:aminobenzoyl-glutamate transport protein
MSEPSSAPKSFMQKVLDVVEKVGNKVPHPAVIFLVLIAFVMLFSHILNLMGTSVTTEVVTAEAITPKDPKDQTDAAKYLDGYPYPEGLSKPLTPVKKTAVVNSLLTTDGLRFMYVSLIPSFMSFTGLGLIIVAMIGVGVAEEAGLVGALIRKLVIVSPRWALVYILAFVGILSSVAADAGYLVLIPLAGAAFASVGRHPLAGLALGFAAVAAAFTVNMFIKPLDAVLVEFTNDAIHLVDPNRSIGLASNLWFSCVSVPFLTILIAFITERIVEPRLGAYKPEKPCEEQDKLADEDGHSEPRPPEERITASPSDKPPEKGGKPAKEGAGLSADESRGLRWAGVGLLGILVLFGLLTLLPGAPLQDPHNPGVGGLIGNSPFMNGLIAFIMLLFLVTGAAYALAAKKFTNLTDVIKAIEKSMSGLGGLIFLFFILSQFVAYFNYTNLGVVMALKLAAVLNSAKIGPLWLLIGFIVVVLFIDLFITGAIAKWAIFAPVFVPVLLKLGVAPEAVLAAYRVGDSPINAITPLNAYFALVVTFAQKYDQRAGVGTIVALMLPYVGWLILLWTLLFVAWFLLGLPWGL